MLPGDGRFTGKDVREHYKADTHHHAPTRLVAVEDTHNQGGGSLWPREQIADVLQTARELSLPVHLDGARIWNAAVASGKSERDLAAGFDSVSVCLSKGLGAPVGSLVCGSKDFIHRAHRFRKVMGGGMRQAGVLAAAGLYALDNNRMRLAEDHENAQILARGLSRLKGLTVDPERVQSNIVMVGVEPPLDATVLAARAKTTGLLFNAVGSKRFRLVTHLDVGRAACEEAARRFASLLA
jgi:threonine aldolase